jgi:hypothetical protein
LVRAFNDICEGRRAKFESNVEEISMGFLIVISDDIRVVVRFLENINLAGGESDKILQEALNSYCTPLEGALVYNRSVRPKTLWTC